MDTPEWYAISVGALVALSIISCIILFFASLLRIYGKFYVLKYVFYPQLPRFLPGRQDATGFDLLILVAFLGGNILSMKLNVRTKADFISRSAMVCTINLIPLALGARMNIIASRCGIKLSTYSRAHRWLGRVAIIEGLIHVAVAMSSQKPDLRKLHDIAGLVGAITLLLTLCSGLLRRHLYEFYLNLHLVLVTTLTAALYLHTPSRELTKPPTVYLLVAISLQSFIGLVRFASVLYRRKPLTRALIQAVTFKRPNAHDISVSDLVHVHVKMPRYWKPRAGQYVYICIPGVSHTSFIQSHPVYVSWWYCDPHGDKYAVFIFEKQRGFTRNLFLHAGDYFLNNSGMTVPVEGAYENVRHLESYTTVLLHDAFEEKSAMRAAIEGPYGKELRLDSYGTVLLFATGIGIAGQLPYVTQLLAGYLECKVKTRRIALFWEVESERHTAWVADKMQELLKQDVGRILDIHLYVVSNFISANRKGDYEPLGERIDIHYSAMDPEALITSEIEDRKGRTVVSFCADDETSMKIRKSVRKMLDKDISLEELDFRPGRGKGRDSIGAMVTRRKRRVASV